MLELRASDSDKSATATTAADIVDHFRVEMKAWIPHAEILDPYAPAEPVLFPRLLAPYLAEPLRACVSSVFAPNASPLTVARITSRFAGDAHTGFGVVDAASPDYRIRTFAEFDFDGAKISDFRTDSGVGLTSRVIRASSGTRSASCAQTATANPAFWTRAVKTGDTTFTIGVSGYDPLVPRTLADWPPICERLPAASQPSCREILRRVPLTPSIDGSANGRVATDGTVTFDYATDYFPNYGLAVKRNDDEPWDSVINATECVPATGYLGAATILARLQSDLDPNRHAAAMDTPDRVCDLNARSGFAPALINLLIPAVNPVTEPLLLILNSYLPAGA